MPTDTSSRAMHTCTTHIIVREQLHTSLFRLSGEANSQGRQVAGSSFKEGICEPLSMFGKPCLRTYSSWSITFLYTWAMDRLLPSCAKHCWMGSRTWRALACSPLPSLGALTSTITVGAGPEERVSSGAGRSHLHDSAYAA